MAIRLNILVAAITVVAAVSPAIAEYTPNEETIRLVDCGDTMAYAANYSLMSNNEGKARVLMLQYARALSALFAKNYEDGMISGEKTAVWKQRRQTTKRYLDENQSKLNKIVDECYPVINRAVNSPEVRNSRMWGKNFEEVVEFMAEKGRAQYGLK